MSIMRSAVSSSILPSVFAAACHVDDFALTLAERQLFAALNRREVRFIVLGMGAALLEGAPVATQDLDVWFETTDDARIRDAAQDAGRIDIVLTAHGLDSFPAEYERTIAHEIDGVALRILPLDRIIATKRATGRPKDLAQLPALEATLLARTRKP